jgi:hypothetical protein
MYLSWFLVDVRVSVSSNVERTENLSEALGALKNSWHRSSESKLWLHYMEKRVRICNFEERWGGKHCRQVSNFDSNVSLKFLNDEAESGYY